VPLQDDLAAAFHCAHEERYGFAERGRTVELVAVRTAEIRPGPDVELARAEETSVSGPSVVELPGSTCWLPPGWVGVRDGRTLLLTRT
jgi:N-methylhydantoinase A/oxoprolinase/acetone carboxylase beta subunit